jgi:phosphoglycerate dehydrogenase-like enzyme
MVIYIDAPFGEEHKAILRSGTHNDELIFKDEIEKPEDQLQALLRADILLGNPKPADWLKKAMNLKWIQLHSTGFDAYAGIKTPAIVTNMKDYYAQPCAETAIAGIMALYRGMDQFALLKEQHQWVGYPVRAGLQLLSNKKVIILGAGSLGKHVAKILSAFDCEISFYARTAPEAVIHTPEQLLAAIPSADIIIGCLPGTVQTRGSFTAQMIRKMSSQAVFCNIGRGNLLEDESVLVEALQQKRIGGAVLDVTATEPLPADSPLWDCPNTILSQHSGGGNVTENEGIARFFLKNLERFRDKQPLLNIIHLERGY